MTPTDPALMTVDELSGAYERRELSPVETLDACLRRIDAHRELNAFLRVDEDAAQAAARASEERWRRGGQRSVVDGVPATVKDTMALEGWPTLKCSPQADPEKLAPEDAPSVGRMKAAGAVILGKTTTPEYGWKGVGDSPLAGVVRNPWDPGRTPGGSSAGAAVAAATGMATLNPGTDGGGSVRIPAAFCGIFGLKPTFATIPIAPASTGGLLSHVGPLTRTVRDAAHMMDVVAHPDPREVYPVAPDDRSWLEGLDDGIAGLRVAYSPDFGFATGVDPQVAAAVERAAGVLSDLGANVERADPAMGDPRDGFLTIWDALLAMTLVDVPPERRTLSDPGLVATTERGERLSAIDLVRADATRVAVTVALNTLLAEYDVLVSPQIAVLPFAVGRDVPDPDTMEHWIDWTPFTYPVNLSRHPAASVPVGLSAERLPIAMQVLGRHHEDRLVLRVARAYERAHPFVLPVSRPRPAP